MTSIITDQTQLQLVADGGKWTTLTMERYYGGSAISSTFAATEFGDTGHYGRLSLAFQGTQIALFGSSPPARASQNIQVSIDGGTPYATTYGDSYPPSVLQWYLSPLLPDGNHTLVISQIAGASLDYVVTTPGPSTPLDGQEVILDDGDASITYAGPWVSKGGTFQTGEQPFVVMPYGGAVHQAQGKGATAVFQFTGTAITLYGVQDFSHLGTMQVVYTLDGVAYPQTYTVTLQTPEYHAAVIQRGNTPLFTSPPALAAGNHTLKVEVLSLAEQMSLMLDYIVYTPSADALAAIPTTTLETSTAPTETPTLAPVPVPTVDESANHKLGGVPIAAVAGGAAGAVVIIALLLFLYVRSRRRVAPRDGGPVTSWAAFTERAELLRVAPFAEPKGGASNTGRPIEKPRSAPSHSRSPTPDSTPSQPLWSRLHFQLPHRSSHTHTHITQSTPPSPSSPTSPTDPLTHTQSQSQPHSPSPPPPPRYSISVTHSRSYSYSLSYVPDDESERTPAQRMHEAVVALNRELTESGGEETERVVELRARVEELARERREWEVCGGMWG
ncbi:hypothetical protein H0H81_001243 [Sphagnurus paluster]|uniref:Transmembrane protein n=1 Tax=Sphagnurus paluster TaxID=117069 RepID=A0A9P7GMD6_9AGAR|nr:hypothetical protein H0H81_001243 [Sphagnurus paluster]